MNPGSACPAWCDRLMAAFTVADHRATELMTGLNGPQLNWQPAAAAWSIGQCLEHLCIANDIYLPAISRALANHAPSAVANIEPGWFARWFIANYIEPAPKTKRVQAPKKIAPPAHVEPSVLDRFLRSNQAARELVLHAGAYDVNRIRFRNPFIPIIYFTVGTGLEIVCAHQRRHLLQAEGVKRSAGLSQASRQRLS